MKTRTPLHVLLATVMTLALLPMLSTVSPATADQIWYQSIGRDGSDAPCDESSTEDLATGWTQWAPSWEQWANNSAGGFVCNRQITWAYDTQPISCATGAGAANTCIVGNTGPGGGIVFYVNEANATGSRYMEAASADSSSGTTWCSDTTNVISGTFGTAIGTGKDNTDLMVTGGCTSTAANSARAYFTPTAPVGSWFLPSNDELNALNSQKAVVGGFTVANYWSSSQFDAIDARGQNFDDGVQPKVFVKSGSYRVRPVRAF
jgi:hypothetical protein